MNRRQYLQSILAMSGLAALPRLSFATDAAAAPSRQAVIGAAWRGPNKTDPYFAGSLVADWDARSISIRYAVPLPTRPHGLLAEEGGGLLVAGVRPGAWLLRCDGQGNVMQTADLAVEGHCRLGGHVIMGSGSDVIYTTETDQASGRGRVGVRDRKILRKLAEWNTHGIDPHQLLLDSAGHLIVANGGVPRTSADKKYDLHRMDSSLVRIDANTGQLVRQWRLDDARLSMRHLAWSTSARSEPPTLGIAIQAEHDEASLRTAAPIFAILDNDNLIVPTRANDGIGYAGDITAAHSSGFALSSNQVGLAQLWHPGVPDKLTPIVTMKEAYALSSWTGPGKGGGVLIATALGLARWHPSAKPLLIPWPQPMALDNHWVLQSEA